MFLTEQLYLTMLDAQRRIRLLCDYLSDRQLVAHRTRASENLEKGIWRMKKEDKEKKREMREGTELINAWVFCYFIHTSTYH
jgi:hypothetical protein